LSFAKLLLLIRSPILHPNFAPTTPRSALQYPLSHPPLTHTHNTLTAATSSFHAYISKSPFDSPHLPSKPHSLFFPSAPSGCLMYTLKGLGYTHLLRCGEEPGDDEGDKKEGKAKSKPCRKQASETRQRVKGGWTSNWSTPFARLFDYSPLSLHCPTPSALSLHCSSRLSPATPPTIPITVTTCLHVPHNSPLHTCINGSRLVQVHHPSL
jgi:hypothetical protein